MKQWLIEKFLIPFFYCLGLWAGRLHGVYDLITGKIKRNK